MTTITAPICSGCKHYRPESPLIACDAYPGGIPDAIVRSEADHRKPYAGDHGIRFEPESADDSKYADTVFPAPLTSYAVNVDAEVWAYSPGQKRDTKGRFGSGGGGASGSSGGGGNGSPGGTTEGAASNAALNKAKDAALAAEKAKFKPKVLLFGHTSSWDEHDAADRIGSDLKAQAMNKVGADLDARFPEDRLLEEARRLRHGIRVLPGDVDGADTPGKVVADAMMGNWAANAYDINDPPSVAIQRAISDEFKSGLGPKIEKDIAKIQPTLKTDLDRHDQEILRAGVRSMYDHTQKRLDDLGVGPAVTLYRGVGRETRGDGEVDMNPASSWSTDPKIASKFARHEGDKHAYYEDGGKGSKGTVFTMTVPRSRIISVPGSGLGCFEEAEVVLVRQPGDHARAQEPGAGQADFAGGGGSNPAGKVKP